MGRCRAWPTAGWRRGGQRAARQQRSRNSPRVRLHNGLGLCSGVACRMPASPRGQTWRWLRAGWRAKDRRASAAALSSRRPQGNSSLPAAAGKERCRPCPACRCYQKGMSRQTVEGPGFSMEVCLCLSFHVSLPQHSPPLVSPVPLGGHLHPLGTIRVRPPSSWAWV